MDDDRAYKAFIVEGEAREPLIIENISNVFFRHENYKIITLPAGENIYMLWKKLKEDDFDTDIIEVLRENSSEVREQLADLQRDDFAEVYLFFDYDVHHTNLGKQEEADVIAEMLESFDNETENGKLYISYPMVEALRDFQPGECGQENTCFISMEEIKDYKRISAERAYNENFKEYNFNLWKEIVNVFAMRVSCLLDLSRTLEYEQYRDVVTPSRIYDLEEKESQKERVFVLSAFPEFLVDYFGMKFWKSCVKRSRNRLEGQSCGKGMN